jgi:cysteine desulfurase/selenocysteine lyase
MKIIDDTDWEAVRHEFAVTRDTAYLNSAAAGPVSRAGVEAATNFYREMMETGDARWDEWLRQRELARARVAEFINAEPDEIAFTINTSSGMNLIVDSLEERGEVISCELEFPVSTLPWLHRGVTVHQLKAENGELRAETIEHAMTNKTAIISISHVQYSNGFRADLEAIGQSKKDHTFVVNASQSLGVLPVDVKRMGIDALCVTGHKWLLAGYGSGFVYLSRELLERTKPRAIGWLSVEESFAMRNREFYLRRDAAARAELGCPHFAGIFALGASLEYLLHMGTEKIEQRALWLNRHLTARLTEVGWEILSPLRDEAMRSAETLVAVKEPARVVAHLANRRVSVTEKPQGIRIATHFFNNEADIAQLIDALAEIRSSTALIDS